MDQLPVELLEKILIDPKLSTQDVFNFAFTCSYFYNSILNSSAIWKSKFFEKWPQFADLFSKEHTRYFEEFQYIYDLKKRTRALLATMPPRFYKKYELSDIDLEEWKILINEQERTYHYLVLDLTQIVNTHAEIKSIEVVPLDTPGNKTMQYYACKVLRYIRQLYLSKVWTAYMSLPPKLQILERGAVFVAQWCQPDIEISYNSIAEEFDRYADLVRRKLYEQNPNHSLFNVPKEYLELWRVQKLDKNQFKVEECRQIIVALREVIYTDLGFSGNNVAYYIPQNSLINKVIESRKGLPITLAIIFESVGRRLGLIFEPISFPAHFLLRFTEGDDAFASWYYIDIFNGGNIVQKSACPHSRFASQKTLFPVATAQQVIERIANNLELSTRQHIEANGRVTRLRSILELLKLVSPQDLSALVSLAKLYMLHNMNTRSLENYLMTQSFNSPEQAQRILHMLRDFSEHHEQNEIESLKPIEATQRANTVKFAVGMVMTHTSRNYKCVIYDWDPICLATPEWQTQMAVYKLSLKHEQPFYNVLVEDGSYRYVAQENMIPSAEVGSLHLNQDLGRHFSHFFENHFVPNAEKEKEYPADTKVRHRFYHEMQLVHYKP